MKVMFSIPADINARMRAFIPARQRSQVVTALLRQELDRREKILFNNAKALEQCEGLNQEMAQWDDSFIGDGLDEL